MNYLIEYTSQQFLGVLVLFSSHRNKEQMLKKQQTTMLCEYYWNIMWSPLIDG